MEGMVKGCERLREHFGFYPTFHDDEVLGVSLDRKGPTVTLTILSRQPGRQGKHGSCTVTIRFGEVSAMELKDLNHQNVIEKMSFRRESASVATDIRSSFGLEGRITSKEVEVVSVE